MGSHVLAIGLSWLAYVFIRRLSARKKFNGNTEKILSLAGYTNGLLLLIFAILIIVGAVQRIFNPLEIIYKEAILVACIGLFVNIASAFLLHHKKSESDHNIRAAYLHVIADTLTSVSAIAGLIAAMIWDLVYVDTIAALLSSVIIIKWSYGLLKDSGKELLDVNGHSHSHH
jgi:cation diffusion facilitator family transporter